MATEYINTETGCQYLRKYKIEDGTSFLYDEGFNDGIETAISCIGNEIPAADVRPVVLCRDCKKYNASIKTCEAYEYGQDGLSFPEPDDFCSNGERW